ncbi:MAG: hypothetical protein P4M04_16675 [Acidobacteriota bacterium]|nr:hypothetical protein [Acidobacteriota bacterium]
MAAINGRRVLYGALAGGVVWNLWSMGINQLVLGPHYAAAQQAGAMLAQPRYPFFVGQWILMLFVASYIVAWIYASVRATRGAGPRTAFRVGIFVGFLAGFPSNFAMATWSPLPRIFPLWWMMELWVGAILATLVAGWIYRE